MISTEWHRQGEGRAISRLALDPNLAAVQAHQFLHERETDSGALVSAAVLTFDTMESFEHARQLRFREARTPVFFNEPGVGLVGGGPGLDPGGPCEFECIGNEV